MSNVNTTISINAVDNTASTFSKLQQSASKVYDSILQQATKNAKVGQDVLKQIENEIQAYQRKQRIQLEGQKALLRQEFESTYSKQSITERKKSIQTQEAEELSSTSDIIKKSAIKKKYQGIYGSFDSDIVKEKEVGGQKLEESFKNFDDDLKNTNILLKDMVETLKSDVFKKQETTQREQILQDAREVTEGKRSDVSADIKAVDLGAARGMQEQKQKDGLYEKIRNTAIAAYVGNKIGQVANGLAGAEDSETFIADALGGIPIVGDAIRTAQTRHLKEHLQQQRAKNQLRAVVGADAMNGKTTMASSLGLDGSEFMPIALAVAKARNSSKDLLDRGGKFGEAGTFASAQKAFGLSEGVLLGSLSAQKFDINKVDMAKTVGAVASILGTRKDILGGKVDMTKLEDLMAANNALTEDQLTTLEESDQKTSVGVMKAFTQLGGRYNDPNVMKERIMQINNSLKNPQNEFQQARNFAVLSELNPNASYFDILKEQSKGIYAKGFLSKTLKQTEQQFGTGDMGKLSLMQQFGFTPDQAEKFMEGYKKDRTMFDNMGEEGIKSYLTEKDIREEGKLRVAPREKEQAVISDAFASGAWNGVVQVGEYVAKDLKGAWDKVITGLNLMGVDMEASAKKKGVANETNTKPNE